jgi:hypothetical protein
VTGEELRERNESKRERMNLKMDSGRLLRDALYRLKFKNDSARVNEKEETVVEEHVYNKKARLEKEGVFVKDKNALKERLVEKKIKFEKEGVFEKEKTQVKERVLDQKKKLEKEGISERKETSEAKFGLNRKPDLRSKIEANAKADIKSKMSAERKAYGDSIAWSASEKARENASSKRLWMAARGEKDRILMDEQAKKFKEIVADIEKEGVKVDLENSWFALDKEQFIVDGKKIPKEVHEKFISKYVTSADGWGYYYGPIQVRGRGIYLDYKDLVKK